MKKETDRISTTDPTFTKRELVGGMAFGFSWGMIMAVILMMI
jgi:hypothetical protein